MQGGSVLILLLVVWSLGLTGVLSWVFVLLRRFTKDASRGNILDLLDKVLKKESESAKKIKDLETSVREIAGEITTHIQKVGLVKFNPFKELGGDHSFSLALLDKDDSGVLLTSLHTRERTRVYIKAIKKGKCEYELSSEEKKALKKAIIS